MSTALLSLLQLSDPALPIGAYAHSGGLETYVQEGIVHDVASAERFVRDMLSTGLHHTDAALVSLAYTASGRKELLELDGLCQAVKIPKEIREASIKLGGRLLKVFGPLYGLAGTGGEGGVGEMLPRHYSVAFGFCASVMGTGLQEALTGFYYNAAAGIVTNCVKLIPIGQQDGQRILFDLQSLIASLVMCSMAPDRELIGLCCTGLDIQCMQHEQLYSRLYMS